jgi:hypothetical protein
MTTVQIIGIAVASLAVLLLIVALIVTRRRSDQPDEAPRAAADSFLDEAPQDTLAGLGKPDQPVEDITLDPGLERLAAERRAEAAGQAQLERQPAPGGLGLDWGPDLSVRTTVGEPEWAEPPRRDDDAETTGELRPDEKVAPPAEDIPPAPEGESGDRMTATPPAQPAEGGPAADEAAAQESGSGGRLVPLSDIIVTTSGKMVDLDDPEVRRMLTELVTFEIDQASEFRKQGQTIDAVLQLTEAEKVSRALGMNESAQRIRAMMNEIRGE